MALPSLIKWREAGPWATLFVALLDQALADLELQVEPQRTHAQRFLEQDLWAPACLWHDWALNLGLRRSEVQRAVTERLARPLRGEADTPGQHAYHTPRGVR